MCGISGYFLHNYSKGTSHNIGLLLNSIRFRGPDDEGICLVNRQRNLHQFYKEKRTVPEISSQLPHLNGNGSIIKHDVALIHTRYSIIDLTEYAHQPFLSNDKSVVGIFNGEIYNYIELRNELSKNGVNFRTSSDTEVLIEGYRIWGDRLWSKMNGFWAVALYDFREQTAILSRDRIGVAPLYYRETKDGFFFASSIQSLLDIDPAGIELNQDVTLGFAQTGVKDHDDTTCYKQIKSLPSSTNVVFGKEDYKLTDASHKKYWNLPNLRFTTEDISFPEAIKEYRDTFFSAVEIRLRADVKVAFELSGGLDSSSVVAAAAILRDSDITTYTAEVKGSNEVPYARSMLSMYPIKYKELSDLEDDLIEDLEYFSKIMEEPFDNPNAYTHHRMLQIMKKDGVDVVVTGAGGDEVLSGYESSFWPKAYIELKNSGHASYMHADIYEFCRRFKTFQETKKTLRHYLIDSARQFLKPFSSLKSNHMVQTETSALNYLKAYSNMAYHDRTLFHFDVALLPFYMRSSDHFTMSIPIEHRFPLLDYRMIELGMQLPCSYLFKNGWTKYILRKAMEPYMPKKILWRRKKLGFFFPYGPYLKAKKEAFKPMLLYLKEINFPLNEFESYDNLCQKDPVKLWRLVSIAIWVKYNLGQN